MMDKREDAVKMIEEELEKEHEKMIPTEPILNYLIAKAKENREFSERVMLEEKTIKECFEYVLQEVKKALEGRRNGWLDDPVVYGFATDYFVLDGELVEKKPEPPKRESRPYVPPIREKEEKEEKPQMSLFEFGGDAK